jgi:hypothetical protein
MKQNALQCSFLKSFHQPKAYSEQLLVKQAAAAEL